MPYKDKDQQKKHSKEYGHSWYQAHKDKVIERRKQDQSEIKEWYRDYKSQLQCSMCGENHPACLQFHHRDRGDKSFNIGDMAGRPSSKKRLINEIAKCDVLCVNCHAKLHWEERHE